MSGPTTHRNPLGSPWFNAVFMLGLGLVGPVQVGVWVDARRRDRGVVRRRGDRVDWAEVALVCGTVCAIAACVALIVSWSATGPARGIASGVLACTGVGLAGAWYRQRQRGSA